MRSFARLYVAEPILRRQRGRVCGFSVIHIIQVWTVAVLQGDFLPQSVVNLTFLL